MLFPSLATTDSCLRLWRDFKDGRITGEVLYRKLLAIDPENFIALVGTGKALWEIGDLAGAEESYWRAIQMNPCMTDPYLDLGRLLHQRGESPHLAIGIAELGMLKQSRHEADEEVLIPRHRADEPEGVTERLRPLRLIEQMEEECALTAETVDAIIAEGPAMVPLLVGVLRAWAQDFFDDGDDSDLENALALLGETGSETEIPHLLEFVDLANDTASGASFWALGRIIQRYPEESARFLESIAGELRMAARIKVAEQILCNPEFDPAAKLLVRLCENIESTEQDDRDALFPVLLSGIAVAKGNEGLQLARAALRRQGSLLSRSARRDCEELLAIMADEGIKRNSLPPSPLTVYDICAGDANWEEDEEPDEEMEDDFAPAPEPIRRKVTPGRNDPCWCNSGKKYKKCHLDSDALESRQIPDNGPRVAQVPDEFYKLRRSIGEFLGQVLPQREAKQATLEFYGDRQPDETEIPLIDWMIHDRFSPTLGRTVLEDFLKRRGSRLTDRERRMAEAWSLSYVGLYEVQYVDAGTGVELKDLIFGETFFAHDVAMSRKLVKWDGLLTRVVPGERGTELAGSGLTVPRDQLAQFRAWLDNDRENSGLEWREYLKGNWPRIRSQAFEIAENRVQSIKLANSDGEELLFSKSVYAVDETKAIQALERCSEFSDDSREKDPYRSFVWLDAKNTLLGNMRIGGGELTLECNSKARLDRGKLLISELTGESVRHLRDEFTTQTDLKRRLKEEPRSPRPISDEIPKDVRDQIVNRALDDHYSKWPDIKLPALDGKTPQAMKTAQGREQVVELLKLIENGEERKRHDGDPVFDVSRLRVELGLEE